MDELMTRIKHLPEELETQIWKDTHGFNLYKVNQKIKYESKLFGVDSLNYAAIYEYWYQLGLKELPKNCWKKMSNHHKRYSNNYRWHLFEMTGEPYYEDY